MIDEVKALRVENAELRAERDATCEALTYAREDLAAARREVETLRLVMRECAEELDTADKEGGAWERIWDARARLRSSSRGGALAAPGDGEDAGFAETTAKDGETYVTRKPQGSG